LNPFLQISTNKPNISQTYEDFINKKVNLLPGQIAKSWFRRSEIIWSGEPN